MSESILNETTTGLSAAARQLPSLDGKAVHPATLCRWITTGIAAPDGERVRLEAVRLGGAWVTSLEALERFAERLSPVPDDAATIPVRTPNQRRRASERAAEQLSLAGV